MDDLEELLRLDAIAHHQARRTHAIHTVLQPHHPPATPPPKHEPLTYALAHHLLEGAEAAARNRDADTLTWYRDGPTRDWAALTTPTSAGPRMLLAPAVKRMVRSPLSDTPYYVIEPSTTPAPGPLRELACAAFTHVHTSGLATVTAGHAAVICLTGQRRADQILRNFSITRLPGTVFTDHIGDPAVLGRDLIHEAAHNWLNDALAALNLTISDTATFFSPWRATYRPAFGFLHACFAFPLTAIYAARTLPQTSGTTRTVLADHLRQQQKHLARTGDDFDQALKLIDNDDLRTRLQTIYRTAQNLNALQR